MLVNAPTNCVHPCNHHTGKKLPSGLTIATSNLNEDAVSREKPHMSSRCGTVLQVGTLFQMVGAQPKKLENSHEFASIDALSRWQHYMMRKQFALGPGCIKRFQSAGTCGPSLGNGLISLNIELSEPASSNNCSISAHHWETSSL